MSRVYSDTVLPEDSGVSQDLTLGTTNDTVQVTSGATLKVNTVKDSGGNTLFTSDGSGNLSSLNSGFSGGPTLLATNTETDAASSSFTTGIDNTYRVYIFKFIDINPATDEAQFSFQAGASSYDTTITSSTWRAYNGASGTAFSYLTSEDQAQGTGLQHVSYSMGNDADECLAGQLYLFNPSDTVRVKHFYARTSVNGYEPAAIDYYAGGYFNTTTALTQVQFKMASGNFDGIIKMYGM